ncbi:MAG: hypothetical protein HKN72_15425 [Gemmatimonadetes bacterium]|nr:hypothetical protein [Gemmatimonadota bacterium]
MSHPNRRLSLLLAVVAVLWGCGPQRVAVVGPVAGVDAVADGLERSTRLDGPTRIDFAWRLNESGSRLAGVGVARIEPPYRARLDLFLENGESVISAALVDDELRLPPGAPDDVLPPTDMMWATLGVFRPVEGTRLIAGEELEDGAQRLRYARESRGELHFEVAEGEVRSLEVLESGSVVEWVRLEPSGDGRYPESAVYRNLVDFRELIIERRSVQGAEPFDSAIWDPR